MPDERTYGFSKPDADELIQLIGGGDVEYPEMRAPVKRGRKGGDGVGFGDFVEDADPDFGECPVTQTPPRSAIILVTEPPPGQEQLGDTSITVYDPLGCIFDEPETELEGVRVVFSWGNIKNPLFDDDPESECYNPNKYMQVWTAVNRCCVE